VFSVYLPAVAPPAETKTEAAPAPVAERPVLVGMRLLLCEDEDGIREVLARGLRRHGLMVEAVADAEEAMAALAGDARFDALLSDVMMPGVDGVELARRARSAHPTLPILLMSGFAEPPLHKAAEMAGIGFIAKPFALGELMESLSEAIGQPER